MTNNENQMREFEKIDIDTNAGIIDLPKRVVKFIEFAAVEQLRAEHQRIYDIFNNKLIEQCSEITKLKADLKIAVELIEQIRYELRNKYDSHHLNAYCMADDYLSKLKNEGV